MNWNSLGVFLMYRSTLRWNLLLVVVAVLLSASAVTARSPFSLIRFTRNKEVAKSSNLLTEENGPWMIFAASFAGPGAEDEARELVQDLRSKFRLSAYLHRKNYDFTDTVKGKGYDRYGNPKRMRYATSGTFDEYAVLVGDYPSIDDARLRKHLEQIKYALPESLNHRGKAPTTQRFAGLRELHKRLSGNKEEARKGPMAKAFATRNPMLPREVDVTSGLDPFLVKLNKDSKYSLLNCPGKYTVRVASYRGQVVIDQRKVRELKSGEPSDRLAVAGEKAEELAALLRERGVEAYAFHDRHESIVTVGSFAQVGTKLPDGRTELDPGIAKIIEKYGPSQKPLLGPQGVALKGIQPKALRNGKYVFDVAPRPVVVPRRSIGNDYVSAH